MIQQIIMSMLLGMVPEVLFFSLSIIFTKNIKEKRMQLIILMAIGYVLCMFIRKYEVVYYILYIVIVLGILKLLYGDKIQKIDIFVISIFSMYMTFLSYICFKNFKEDLSNYYILYALDRVLLFVPLIFRNKYNIIYKKYCSLWNRDDNSKKPIKSITLRSLSLIIINIAIVLMNIYAVSIIKFIQ